MRISDWSSDGCSSDLRAGPSEPVEVLGLQGTPSAGDDFVVVEDESRAREISSYRQRQSRKQSFAVGARGSLEQMFDQIKAGEAADIGSASGRERVCQYV